MNKVRKRNGKVVDYNCTKIFNAIKKANKASSDQRMNANEINQIVQEVEEQLKDINIPSVERIQDTIEKILMNSDRQKTAKSYIIYRSEHAKARELPDKLMETLTDLTFKSSKDMESRRDNANINTDTSMGIMLKLGTSTSNFFNDNYIIPAKFVDAHRNGLIHIHDKDFLSVCFNCCQVDIIKLFEGGFNTGHGHLREPNSIRAASNLACIAIQSNQNEMFGGQSIPNFDYAMAKYVDRSFKKALKHKIKEWYIFQHENKYTEEEIDNIANNIYENIKAEDVRYSEKEDKERTEKNISLLTKCIQDKIEYSEIRKIYRLACKDVEDETYQAMEALIHNFNTLHCLPAYEKIWVYDNDTQELGIISMQDLHDTFKTDKYEALSINTKTGELERKKIKAVQRKDNNRRLITIKSSNNHKVTVTDNHKTLYLSNNGYIMEDDPERLPNIIMPRKFSLGSPIEKILLEPYKGARETQYYQDYVEVTPELAKMFGYYVAEGCENQGVLEFTVCNKNKEQELLQLIQSVYPNKHKENYTTYTDSKGQEKPKCINIYVGVALASMFKDKCGSDAKNKKIPLEIMYGSDEIKREFLNGYLKCDGSIKNRNIDASTVSELLQKQLNLLVLSLGEMPRVYERDNINYYSKKIYHSYDIGFNSNTSNRLCLEFNFRELRCELNNYNYDFLYDVIYRNLEGKKPRKDRMRKEKVYNAINTHRPDLNHITKIFPVPIETLEESNSGKTYVYDIAVEDNENFLTADGILVHNSRAGAQTPFSSINFGTDTTPEGRLVIKNVLRAIDEGLGNGETAIFPISIFRIKEGLNYNPSNPNYDLFKYSMKVSAKRLFPNFENQDATYNMEYYPDPDDYRTMIATMGCRTRVIGNHYDPTRNWTSSRGNFSFTTINLPKIALDTRDKNGKPNIDKFYKKLNDTMELCRDQLIWRFNLISKKHKFNFPFLMGQGVWLDSDKIGNDDTIGEILKHASLSIGFCGLAECLIVLTGKHHGESEESQKLGLEIISKMRETTDKFADNTGLSFSLFSSPAESTAGRFAKILKKQYGIIPNVSDRDYITNSSHVPVWYKISAFKKIDIEAPYHEKTNAGHILYVEMDGDPIKNLEAFETLVRYMHDKNAGYYAINHPVDRCPRCGATGIIKNKCMRCGYEDMYDDQEIKVSVTEFEE